MCTAERGARPNSIQMIPPNNPIIVREAAALHREHEDMLPDFFMTTTIPKGGAGEAVAGENRKDASDLPSIERSEARARHTEQGEYSQELRNVPSLEMITSWSGWDNITYLAQRAGGEEQHRAALM